MTRQYNGHYDLDVFNSELETRIQEQGMNQFGMSMQWFVERTMYIHRFNATGGCFVEPPFKNTLIWNIKITDN